MKKIMSLLLGAAMFTSTLAVSLPAPAEAASKKYCRSYAKAKADKKTTRKAVRNAIVGGVVGGLIGSVVGGRRTTAFGAVGGAATGVLATDGQWQRTYNNSYAFCRQEL
jgi:uncharacterized protein YcfJ